MPDDPTPHAPDPASEPWVRRLLPWLERLADPADVPAAATALFEIHLAEYGARPEALRGSGDTPEEREADGMRLYVRALDALGDRAAALVPRWVERFIEAAREQQRRQEVHVAAIRAGENMPPLDFAGMHAVNQFKLLLSAASGRLDPHLGPMVGVLPSLDRDRVEDVCHVLKHAGPAIAPATPALLDALRAYGVWHWPSQISRALARAAEFDDRVLPALREMLSDPDEARRTSAMQVLAHLGPRAAPAAAQLLSFRAGSEAERVQAVRALSAQGAATPELLDLLEESMNDQSGYVRRAAAQALGELKADPDRFVPLLVAACDQFPHLHDEGLPEAAVRALGHYGPAAAAALPRLKRFVDGPVKGRVVDVKVVAETIACITPDAERATFRPARRPGPVAPDEPLFAVTHQGRQCYVDRHGRLAIETRFEGGEEFSDGRAIVSRKRVRAAIDRAGEIVFESTWDAIEPFDEGLAPVKKDGKWGFVDVNGRVVIEPRYDSVTPFSEGLAGVEVGRRPDQSGRAITMDYFGKRGFINRAGETVVRAEWVEAYPFRGGRAAVCVGGVMRPNLLLDRETLTDKRYGFIDRSGRLVIEGRFTSAAYFSEGLAAVNVGGWIRRSRVGYIDPAGNVVVPGDLTSASDFKDGIALVRRRGRERRQVRYVIDRTGRTVLESRHPIFEPFSEGLAPVWTGEAFGFVNLSDELVIAPQFDQVMAFRDGLAAVQRGSWFGLIDSAGMFVWGPTTEGLVARDIKSEWT